MIKRISILIRRPQDDREIFSKHWNAVHGPLVATLPAVGRYVQNHVIDEFSTGADELGGYDIDGFVELYFADEPTMRGAFAGSGVRPIWEDEPNFLGHSTAYAITGNRLPSESMTDAKLVIVGDGSPTGTDWLEKQVGALETAQATERNDVAEVIPRTTMARGPQPANVFIHVRFGDVATACQAGRRLATVSVAQALSHGIKRLAITRVEEKRIV
jgi:uncharacterized protein (TIGR02118 family)